MNRQDDNMEGRWQRVSDLFDGAYAMPTADRAAWVHGRAAGDAALADEVLALLKEAENVELADSRFATGGADTSVPAEPLANGSRTGPWQIKALIGRGGMGEVYLAERADGAYEQRVALKVVTLASAAARVRFHAERRLLAALEHPGIARILDGGETADGRPYMVMEYVDGEPITGYCASHRLTTDARLRLFQQVCAAVAHAHSRLVIHRDIKPGNVFVSHQGEVKLLDFGIAKLVDPSLDHSTMTQSALTPAYASPEQLSTAAVTTATDVYSLGVVLFQMLTGRTPVDPTGSMAEIIDQVRTGEAPLASAIALRAESTPATAAELTGDLDAILQRTMRRDAQARYATPQALSDDIDAYLMRRPVKAREGGRSYLASRFLRRHAVPVASVVALVVALATGLGASVYFAGQTKAALRDLRVASQLQQEQADLQNALRTAMIRILGRALEDDDSAAVLRAHLDSEIERAVGALADDASSSIASLSALGEMLLFQTDPSRVVAALAPVVEFTEAQGRVDAYALELLGQGYWYMDDSERAETLLRRAAAAYRRDDRADSLGLVRVMSALGHVVADEAAHRSAIDAIETFIPVEQASRPQGGINLAFLYGELATHRQRLDDVDGAIEANLHAVDIYRRAEPGDPQSMSATINNLGSLYYRQKQFDKAAAAFRESIEIEKVTSGNSHDLAVSQRFLADVLIKAGRAAEALPLLDEVDEILIDRDLYQVVVGYVAAFTRAEALLALERTGEALVAAQAAMDRVTTHSPDDAIMLGWSYYLRAKVRGVTGQLDVALADLDRAEALHASVEAPITSLRRRNAALREALMGPGERSVMSGGRGGS